MGGKGAARKGKGAAPKGAAPKGAAPTGRWGRLSKKRVSGQLVTWKGKYGWIRPTEFIDHPAAHQHSGKIYVGIEDIEGEELFDKCMVTFVVYADENGIGAMHCRKAPGLAKPAAKGAGGKGGGGKMQPGLGGGGKGGVLKTHLKQSGGRLAIGAPPGTTKGGWQKGKGAGKPGKGVAVKEELADGEAKFPAPDKAARWRLQPGRIIGRLVKWRGGKMGWIKPVERIECPEAPKHHKRGIYLHEADVNPGQELFQGAQVSFFVYVDGDGLGAEHCMLTKDQPPPPEEGEKPPQSKAGVSGRAKARGKGAASKPEGKLTMVQKMQLKRRRRGGRGNKRRQEGETEDGQEGEKEKTKGGPDLPRERVTELPVSGEVVEWKGKYGWLRATEAIEHELAENHGGKIYVHEKDVLDGAPLKVGQQVEFHVYSDKTGLGAEEALATTT